MVDLARLPHNSALLHSLMQISIIEIEEDSVVLVEEDVAVEEEEEGVASVEASAEAIDMEEIDSMTVEASEASEASEGTEGLTEGVSTEITVSEMIMEASAMAFNRENSMTT